MLPILSIRYLLPIIFLHVQEICRIHPSIHSFFVSGYSTFNCSSLWSRSIKQENILLEKVTISLYCKLQKENGSKWLKTTTPTQLTNLLSLVTYLNTNFSRSSISIAVPGVAVPVFGGDSLLLGGGYQASRKITIQYQQ